MNNINYAEHFALTLGLDCVLAAFGGDVARAHEMPVDSGERSGGCPVRCSLATQEAKSLAVVNDTEAFNRQAGGYLQGPL